MTSVEDAPGVEVYNVQEYNLLSQRHRERALAVVAGGMVLPTLLLYVTHTVLFATVLKSNFYLLFYVPALFLPSSITACLALFRYKRWTYEEFSREQYFSDRLYAGGMWGGRSFARWQRVEWWVGLFMFVLWLYPLNLWLEASGAGAGSPVGKSSCNRTPNQPSTYNPNGLYTGLNQYDPNNPVGFCVLDLKWGYPNPRANYIAGYESLSNSGLNGFKPAPNGLVTQGRTTDYPDPTLGIRGGWSFGKRNGTTEDVTFCPGSTSAVVEFPDGQVLNGAPLNACPVCLSSFRKQNDLVNPDTFDTSGPTGYEHCPYDPSRASSLWCYFCPGRGYGWLYDSVYEVGDLTATFAFITCITFFPFIRFAVWLAIGASIQEKRRHVRYPWEEEAPERGGGGGGGGRKGRGSLRRRNGRPRPGPGGDPGAGGKAAGGEEPA